MGRAMFSDKERHEFGSSSSFGSDGQRNVLMKESAMIMIRIRPC